jgi:hypothetical protein
MSNNVRASPRERIGLFLILVVLYSSTLTLIDLNDGRSGQRLFERLPTSGILPQEFRTEEGMM